MLVLKSTSEETTSKIGKILGRNLQPGTVVALNGELGAGKTVFARGVAEGLDVQVVVNSPSYVIMNLYRGRMELYHFDFYRLEEEEELQELGLEEYFYGDGITLIEWADKFPGVLPTTRVEIDIVKDDEDLENSRILYFKHLGKLEESLIEELKKVASPGY
ncbi:MAG: tRNA (adenosine(37)-N6)-threonylcarbamoyltransferase complex ATPase subunit type 1 TsaE [Dethiobacter sp.]|nr:MAG: tRNA (adenosine(37)-N6)-threonylcarbamoyltransferase complex ATPase subunit type 1 TsaE [Dethiobacter sp.]